MRLRFLENYDQFMFEKPGKWEGRKGSDKAEHDHPSLDVIYSSLKGNVFHQERTDGEGVSYLFHGQSRPLSCCRGRDEKMKICLGTIKIYTAVIDLTRTTFVCCVAN